ncbi:phosphopantetheine-binding protein [Primorskyibacter sp. 2E107]|uniref:phosphopantetheine-binding protein n=1 Tax=Primorskyibacter sp. 2E107 TaxID=3403458 RepID=UPI003AF753AC
MANSDPLSELEAHVQRAFSRAFPGTVIDEDSDFFDLGGESIKAVQIAAAMEGTLGVPVHPSALIQNPTVADFAQALNAARALSDARKS